MALPTEQNHSILYTIQLQCMALPTRAKPQYIIHNTVAVYALPTEQNHSILYTIQLQYMALPTEQVFFNSTFSKSKLIPPLIERFFPSIKLSHINIDQTDDVMCLVFLPS